MLGGKYLNLRLFSEKKNSLNSNSSDNTINNSNAHSVQNVHNLNSLHTVQNLQNANSSRDRKYYEEKTKRYNRDKRIIHEGWLNKWTNIIGSYRPRYFVLENGILRYSIDKYSPTKETFVLSHCKIRVCPDDPLHFEIDTSEQGILYLKADYPEDKHKWYISFKKAQLNYLHGNYNKKAFINVNTFNTSTNSEFLRKLIKSTNDFSKSKTIGEVTNVKARNASGSNRISSHKEDDQNSHNNINRNNSDNSNLHSEHNSGCIEEDQEKMEKVDRRTSCTSLDQSEKNFSRLSGTNKINLDELFISSTDFEDKSPTLCLMENIVSLKEITRDLIKNSEYNEAKQVVNKIKSDPNYKINYEHLGALLFHLSNSIYCIDSVIEKYINCTEMLLKEENIQSKCMNKSLKLLAKQNYFLEKSQDKKTLNQLNVKVKNKYEKFNLYCNNQESEEDDDLFFDCDDQFICDEKQNDSSGSSDENKSARSSFCLSTNEEPAKKKNSLHKNKTKERKNNSDQSLQFTNHNDKELLKSMKTTCTNEPLQFYQKNYSYKSMDGCSSGEKLYNEHSKGKIANIANIANIGKGEKGEKITKGENVGEGEKGSLREEEKQNQNQAKGNRKRDEQMNGKMDEQTDKKMDEQMGEKMDKLRDEQKNAPGEHPTEGKESETQKDSFEKNVDESDSSSGDCCNYEDEGYMLISLCKAKNVKSLNFRKIDIYTDKTIKRRKKLPSPRTDIKISMWSLLKDCIGKDLSRIGMPIYLNEPSSFLQRLAEDFQYIYLLKYASNEVESTSRLAFVTAFTISPYASVIGRTFKPFNPLLGETYELTHRKFYFISEQVVHHPPITAYHCHNEYMENFASIIVNVQILGKSVEVNIPGASHLILKYKKKSASSESGSRTGIGIGSVTVSGSTQNEKDTTNSRSEVKNRKKYDIVDEYGDGNEAHIDENEKRTKDYSKMENDISVTHSTLHNGNNNSTPNCDTQESFVFLGENKKGADSMRRVDSEYRAYINMDDNKIKKNNHLNNLKSNENIEVLEDDNTDKWGTENCNYLKTEQGRNIKSSKKEDKIEYGHEHYTYQRANMIIHNIIFGKLWVELHGNILIRNHNNGDFSIVCYIRKGWFDKEIHKVRGIVCDRFKNAIFYIYGKWSQEIYIAYVKNMKRQEYSTYFFNEDGTENLKHFNRNTLNEFINNFDWQFYENNMENLNGVCVWKAQKRPKHSDQYYGFNNMTVELNEITPEYDRLNGAAIACTDSRFRPDQRNYENGNIEVAMNEKQRLENKQRKNSKMYGEKNSYQPKWFYKNKDPIYKDKDMYLFNNKYWVVKKNRQFTNSPDIF
ncbi:oxysterol-binding protein [Plasmodium brasilianum]|uniref:Oxysterol-binding protein-related protein 2, putative n=2 Tax=Plasmodium (Plasmodium) TaxID=418103 RepID=A0A1D3PCW2_PLAMA|nr:oxysterol-binding protein-related protein 2, putative [Plasmodium malariae]KAI4838437.1 oxysterol-binding protein [Plasmodium brasilianum]SCN12835.1 oxysterol-binding protein-related protein 2, putative [Plasmodium malariae]